MMHLALILLLSTFGGSITLHYLKNFLLKEKRKFRLDWDGILERLCVTYIMVDLLGFWLFIPVVIALKALFRLLLFGFTPGISSTAEPGAASQKVLLKSELALDLFLSPTFAILVGVVFK